MDYTQARGEGEVVAKAYNGSIENIYKMRQRIKVVVEEIASHETAAKVACASGSNETARKAMAAELLADNKEYRAYVKQLEELHDREMNLDGEQDMLKWRKRVALLDMAMAVAEATK